MWEGACEQCLQTVTTLHSCPVWVPWLSFSVVYLGLLTLWEPDREGKRSVGRKMRETETKSAEMSASPLSVPPCVSPIGEFRLVLIFFLLFFRVPQLKSVSSSSYQSQI